ncbi:ribonuclease 3-like protein 2 [Curcuma longa]|uniref:ribonuclease 3-like protein 2 n=1 Tax=Curcuma longa TaxID=136217 RepID=UPI003D9F408C
MEPSSSRNGKVATELDIELRRKVAEIENILGYTFRNKSLLVEAITHGSYAGHRSYQRLEFVGDAVLGLAVSNCLYEKYPDIGSGDLTDLRSANVSNENLARVAVRLGLYRFLRRNSPGLDKAVSKFTEDDTGLKACTVLADMVESIAAAVYRDCDYDLKLVWKIFSKILEPSFITLETMNRGKTLESRSRSSSCGSPYTVDAFVDGMVMGTGYERQVEIAKLNAARDALPKVSGGEAASFEDDGQMLSILQRPDEEGKQPARIPNVKKSAVCSWRFLFFFFFLMAFLPPECSIVFGFGFWVWVVYLFCKWFSTASQR